MKRSLPILFHVTGNFVTLGASWVLGTSGALAKLLALPLFCLVVFAVRLLSGVLIAKRLPALRTILGLKLALLAAGRSWRLSTARSMTAIELQRS